MLHFLPHTVAFPNGAAVYVDNCVARHCVLQPGNYRSAHTCSTLVFSLSSSVLTRPSSCRRFSIRAVAEAMLSCSCWRCCSRSRSSFSTDAVEVAKKVMRRGEEGEGSAEGRRTKGWIEIVMEFRDKMYVIVGSEEGRGGMGEEGENVMQWSLG